MTRPTVGYGCPWCGRAVMRRDRYLKHREECARRPADPAPFRAHSYLCAVCSAMFKTPLACQTHETVAHPRTRPTLIPIGSYRKIGGIRLPGRGGGSTVD